MENIADIAPTAYFLLLLAYVARHVARHGRPRRYSGPLMVASVAAFAFLAAHMGFWERVGVWDGLWLMSAAASVHLHASRHGKVTPTPYHAGIATVNAIIDALIVGLACDLL